jgi:hypothetical protein
MNIKKTLMEISKVTTNISNLLQSTLQVMHQHSFLHHYLLVLSLVVILLLICLQTVSMSGKPKTNL